MTDKIIRPPFIGVIGLQSPVLRDMLEREWTAASERQSRKEKRLIPHVLQIGAIVSWRTLADRRSDLYQICAHGSSDAGNILGNTPGVMRTLFHVADDDSGGDVAILWQNLHPVLDQLHGRLDAIQFDRLPHPDLLQRVRDVHRHLRIICRMGVENIRAAMQWSEQDGPEGTPAVIAGLLDMLVPGHFCINDVMLDWWGTKEARQAHLQLPGFVTALRERYPELGVAIGNLDASWLGHDQVESLLASGPPISLQGMDRLRVSGPLSGLNREAALHFVRMAAYYSASSS